jgi:hypothetical protein
MGSCGQGKNLLKRHSSMCEMYLVSVLLINFMKNLIYNSLQCISAIH